ncbi:MAG: hypothetical protein AAF357_03180 [Verrucomicrobiota bacterium]
MDFVCHDLKTERKEVSGGLPGYLRVVPVLFFAALVICTSGFAWFELSRKQAGKDLAKWDRVGAGYEAEARKVQSEKTSVEAANERARQLASWLEGAHHLQPLIVALGRSAGGDATIAEVDLARKEEIPSQIQFRLKMDGVTSGVLDDILQGIRSQNFRAYSAQQQKTEGSLDYDATLVFQNATSIVAR